MAAIEMVTNKELVDVFGESNIVRIEPATEYLSKFRPEDVEVLCEIGLPRAVAGLFDVHFNKVPQAFETVSISTAEDGSEKMELLCLGAPHGDSEFRYMLDVKQGLVIVLNMEKMMAEVINESLGNFVEFLHRVQHFVQFKSHVARGQELDDHASGTLAYVVDILTAYLGELDSTALADPECWWWRIFTGGPFQLEPET